MFALIAILAYVYGYPTICWVSVIISAVIELHYVRSLINRAQYYVIDNTKYWTTERWK